MFARIAFAVIAAVAAVGLVACSDEGEDTQEAAATFDNVTVAEASQLIGENPEMTILDVRTPEEFAQGHIPEALNIDVEGPDFRSEIQDLPREDTYLVYCRTGNRSVTASEIMIEEGFTDVTNVTGGFSDWVAAGYPVAS